MFTAALSTRARTWKQPKYSSIDEQIKKMVHVHSAAVLSHKKKEIRPFAATWMDLETVILSVVRERQILWDSACMWNLKKWYKRTYLQNRNRVTDVENIWLPGGKGINWKIRIYIYQLLHISIK